MSDNQLLLDRLTQISNDRGFSLSGGTQTIGPYAVQRTVGKGSWGIVRAGTDTRRPSDDTMYAIKTVEEDFILRNPEQRRRVLNEIRLLSTLDHPYVCRLIEVVKGERHRHIVMPFFPGGELYDHILKNGKPTIDEAFRYFYMLVQAVRYLQGRGIAHRDIKLENLIFDEHKNLRLCDFGFATVCNASTYETYTCGSPHYAAPEVIQGLPCSPFAADMWSMGVLLHVLLTGQLPYLHEQQEVLLQMIQRGDEGRDRTVLDGLPSAAKDLLNAMLTANPSQRITLEGLVAHPWFRQRVGRIPLDVRRVAEGA